MFQRFAAGSAIGALVIALAGLVLASFAGVAMPRMWPVTTMWCFVPFAWGIWALLTPRTWLPERLPYWGAILGFLGVTMSVFVLNVPTRVFALTVPSAVGVVVVVVGTIVYYFLWMLVRAAYRSLVVTQPGAEAPRSELKKAA